MKNRYFSITFTILLTICINFLGCGNSTEKKIFSNIAPHMTPDVYDPVRHIGKHSRNTGQSRFDPNTIEWEYDNHEGLKIHLDENTLYLDFTYNMEVANIQFFIDTDNNQKTGNLDEDGAEYMIENGYLYKSTDPNEWKWQEIARLQTASVNGIRDTVAIKLKDIEDLNIVFAVNAQALDEMWHPVVKSPLNDLKSLYTDKNAIDWENVNAYTKNEDKVVKVFDTKDMLYVRLEQKKHTKHVQIYIDSDNNSKTGYTGSNWKNFGRDYLIEDGKIYKYTGTGNWGWEYIANASRDKKEKDTKEIVEVAISKQLFSSLVSEILIGVETNNKDWTDTLFIPDTHIPAYKLNTTSSQNVNIKINEVLAANTNTLLDPDFYNFSDYIEIYNPNSEPVNIGGYGLSDKLNKPKWKFPQNTTINAYEYLIVWADGKDKAQNALHTNFKLKKDGEAVALFNKNGELTEGFEYLKQLPDISIIKSNKKIKYMNPTPGKKNSKEFATAVLAQKPHFSLKEGFYNQTQSLTITSAENSLIYYTTDGTVPTSLSKKYTHPVTVDKSMTIRAICINEKKFTSKVVTKSYIINEHIDIPVISLAIDEKYLSDNTIGIYTIGTNGKKLKDCGDDNFPQKANYAQKWERPAHMTFFEKNNSVILSQDIGLKIAGECSRNYQQKSFQLKADDKYGKDKFSYQIFKDKPIKKFEKIKLRNAGQDFIKTHIRDALIQYMVKDELNVIYEAYRPTLLFINGKFWGIYSLREKLSKEYFKENFKQKKINLLIDDRIVKEGNSDDFDKLVDFLQHNSLKSDDNYNYVASKIDIENYIDYMITNIYSANADWPGTNLVYWKPKKSNTKWQWVLHDMDFGFARYSQWSVDYDAFAVTTAANGDNWPNPAWSTLLFRKLLENENFKSKFINRFISKLNTTFTPQRVKNIIDSLTSKIKPYIQRHIQRWQNEGTYSYAVNSKEDWEQEVEKLKEFANQRAEIVKNQISEHLQ